MGPFVIELLQESADLGLLLQEVGTPPDWLLLSSG